MIVRALLLLIILGPAAAAQEAEPDTNFEARIRAMWGDAREYEGTNRDSLWSTMAAEAFAYYRAHPDTPTGQRAGETAFTMWGNSTAADAALDAAALVPTDSDLWARVLHGVQNAFSRADRRDDYVALLDTWEQTLTHPIARTAVLEQLASPLLMEGRGSDARPYYEAIVALGADTSRVAMAELALYEIDHLGVGMEAPDFEATTLDGDTVRLSDLRGQVVLLDFWATTCGPCLPEIPYFAEAAATDGIAVVSISLDHDPEALAALVEERAMDWPQVWEEGTWESRVPRLYAVQRMPTTFLLDRDGRIASKHVHGEAIVTEATALAARP